MAIKTNTINEMALRLNYNCPSINGFVLKLDLYWYTTGRIRVSSQTTCLWGWHLQPDDNCSLYQHLGFFTVFNFTTAFHVAYCCTVSVFCFHCSLRAFFQTESHLLPTYISKFCRSLFIILLYILGFATPYNLLWSVNLINVMFAKDHKEPSQLYSQKR